MVDELVNASEKVEIKRDEKGRILPGQHSLNPAGKPLGTISIMAEIRKIFREDPEHFKEYVSEIIKDNSLRREIIQQLDGKPRQPIDMDVTLPQTLIDLIKHGATDKTGDT